MTNGKHNPPKIANKAESDKNKNQPNNNAALPLDGANRAMGPANAPTWVIICGAVFGAITLFGLFAIFYVSLDRPYVLCRNTVLLAAIFALGAGLATAFLGGAAAADSNIPINGNPITIAVGGGVGALVVVFMVFMSMAPKTCSSQDASILIESVPLSIKADAGSDVWYKELNVGHDRLSREFRIDQEKFRLIFTSEDGRNCKIIVYRSDDLQETIKKYASKYDFGDQHNLANSKAKFRFSDSTGNSAANEIKEVETFHCVEDIENQIVKGVVIFDVESGKFAFATNDKFDSGESNSDLDGINNTETSEPDVGLMFVNKSYAQEGSLPKFETLTNALASGSDSERGAARRFIGRNLASYFNSLIDIIETKSGDTNPVILADLLSALTDGMGIINASITTGQGETPPRQRDFSNLEEPFKSYLGSRPGAIVALTGHEDVSVKKQARRLLQRFPYDSFLAEFNDLFERLDIECKTRKANSSDQSKLYASIFFGYNRIIENNFSARLDDTRLANEFDFARRVINLKSCFDEKLQPDVALLYYGLALVYLEDGAKAHGSNAIEAAKLFLRTIGTNPESYYMQSHVQKMRSLANG